MKFFRSIYPIVTGGLAVVLALAACTPSGAGGVGGGAGGGGSHGGGVGSATPHGRFDPHSGGDTAGNDARRPGGPG